MIRRVAAIIFALTLTPAVLYAQESVLTVTVPSADVYKGPSTATPVIGHVPRGTVLPVSRNLGSWVKVSWTGAPDGMGYVHVTMGRLTPAGAGSSASPDVAPSTPSALAPAPTRPGSAPATPAVHPGRSGDERVAVAGPEGVTTISHVFGVGGLVESSRGFGATVRAWRHNRLGVELRLTRSTATSDADAGTATSIRFEPGVTYALFDRVSDYVWVRPYVGTGLSFARQTLKGTSPTADSASDNGVGWRLFGGSELTFAGATQFGVSAEVGYRKLPVMFPGFEPDRVNLSIAGHWYIK